MKKTSLGYTVVLSMGLVACGGQVPDESAQGTAFAPASTNPHGPDVSGYQGDVGWSSVKGAGMAFAYIKATESTDYTNPYFSQQYEGSYDQKIIRGAYHFAHPDATSGAAQADYFVDHGGGWSGDGLTLPGALDIEYNPDGATCYGLSAASMVSWLHDFCNEYKSRTTRDAVIYSTANWWNECTGSSTAFASTNPLWVADYGVNSPALPAGWGYYTFWQYTDSASIPGISGGSDESVFNGTAARLEVLAKGN